MLFILFILFVKDLGVMQEGLMIQSRSSNLNINECSLFSFTRGIITRSIATLMVNGFDLVLFTSFDCGTFQGDYRFDDSIHLALFGGMGAFMMLL